jgi:hypothetical protein
LNTKCEKVEPKEDGIWVKFVGETDTEEVFDKENKRYLTNSYPRREINIVHYTGYKYIDVTNFKN